VEDGLRCWFVGRFGEVLGFWNPSLGVEGVRRVMEEVLWCERTGGEALERLWRGIEEGGRQHAWAIENL
jgi:hypothetical protein